MSVAVFPGTFDPVTVGHVDVVNRALSIFERVVVAVLVNSAKQTMLPVELRVQLLNKAFEGFQDRVEVCNWQGLLVDLCRQKKINFVIRGLRAIGDFDFEMKMGLANKRLDPSLETVYFLTSEQFIAVSSSVVRELMIFGGDFSQFVPDVVREDLEAFRKSSLTPPLR